MKKIAITIILILCMVMPLDVYAESLQIYEREGGTNDFDPETIQLSGNADITYNGTLDWDDDHIQLSDCIRLDVEEAGVVSLWVCADGFETIQCDNFLRVWIGNQTGEYLTNKLQYFNFQMPTDWHKEINYTFANGKLYFCYEQYFEKGNYDLALLSSDERNYQCRIQLYPFALSDTVKNISADYISSYTAGSGEFRGCIHNIPWGFNYQYGYENYFNFIVPKDGYYQLKYKSNGIASIGIDGICGLSSENNCETNTNYNTQVDLCINGIPYEWFQNFGEEEKVVYLKAGTYPVSVEGAYGMLSYNTACYTFSAEETEAPTEKQEEKTSDDFSDIPGEENIPDVDDLISRWYSNYQKTKTDSNANNQGKEKVTYTTFGSKKRAAKPVVKRINNLRIKSISGNQIKIKWEKISSVSGYQVIYATRKSFKKGVKKITIKKNKSTIKIRNLKFKTYYLKVRAYKKIKGKKKYGAWSPVMTIRRTKL